jgi:hypothetical protein
MIIKEQLIQELDGSTDELINMLSFTKDEAFNNKITEDSWSIADVAEHLLILETSVNHALQKTHATERPHDLKIEPMRQGLADEEKKFNAPDFVKPTSLHKDKIQLMEGLKKQREILKKIIQTKDLTETADFKHPVIGSMTRFEWIYFNIFHTHRHLKQIEKILSQFLMEKGSF